MPRPSPRPRLAPAGLALAMVCSLLTTGQDARAHSHFPASAIGTVRPGSFGCSFTSCFVVLDFARVDPLMGPQERRSVTLSLAPDAQYTDAGRAIDFDSFVKSLAAGDRIAVISEMDSDGSGGLAGPAFGVARLGRAATPSAALFPTCGAPPWSKETLAACSSAPATAEVELRARVAVPAVTHTHLDKDAHETVGLDQITLRSKGGDVAPPSDAEFIDLTKKRLTKMTKARPNVKSLVAGDRIKLDVVYALPGSSSCSPGCWPTVKAAGPVTVTKD